MIRGQVLRCNIVTELGITRARFLGRVMSMSRPLRIEFAGALYHVTARGNERKPIVRADFDREEWVATLAHVCDRFAWRCLAWCLMDNHFHLVLETPKANLARGMRQLNGRYAQRFNRRHRRVGHLFQGRYKALLVERGPHLLEACRYTVLNPERTRTPRRHDTWRWSSYRASAGLEPAPAWLELDQLLGQFAAERSVAQRRYRAFIRAGLQSDNSPRSVEGEIYFADRAYIRRRGGTADGSPEIPRAQREPIALPLEQTLRAGSDHAIRRAYREGGYTLRETADVLGLHYSTISRRLVAQEQEQALDLLRSKT
jgi:putative transposase